MDKDTAVEVLDKTVDVLEDGLDAFEDFGEDAIRAFPSEAMVRTGLLVAGLGVGVGVSYFILKRRIEKRADEMIEREIDAAREHLKVVPNDDSKPATPSDFVQSNYSVAEAVIPEGTEAARVVVEEIQETVTIQPTSGGVGVQVDATAAEVAGVSNPDASRSIWDNPVKPIPFDYEAEIATRDPNLPYVISFEEFMEGREGFEQGDLTYFTKGDDVVLVDSREEPIDDVERIVGTLNLTKFGYGSNDINVVYIRNENNEMDFTVQKSDGSYEEEVLGLDLKHSDDDHPQGTRRFRLDRD